jgi:xanthine dehydrogenase YagT iron-sulfur-binding subunit
MTILTGYNEISLIVNGKKRAAKVEPRDTLLDVLRDQFELTGTKKGCDEAICSACSVLLNGRSICSCTILAMEAEGASIVTIEGLAHGGSSPHNGTKESTLDPLQQAFVEFDAQQCGFCTSGQIISAKSYLNSLQRGGVYPSDKASIVNYEEIREALSGNICRCGCYNKIVEAVADVLSKSLERPKRG